MKKNDNSKTDDNNSLIDAVFKTFYSSKILNDYNINESNESIESKSALKNILKGINALNGKIGKLKGIQSKVNYSNVITEK